MKEQWLENFYHFEKFRGEMSVMWQQAYINIFNVKP